MASRIDNIDPFKTHKDSQFVFEIRDGVLIISDGNEECLYEYEGSEPVYDLVYAFHDLALSYKQDI